MTYNDMVSSRARVFLPHCRIGLAKILGRSLPLREESLTNFNIFPDDARHVRVLSPSQSV